METNSKQLTTCNGKIQANGFCDKCFQSAETTSSFCGRAILTFSKPLPDNSLSAEAILKKHLIYGNPTSIQDHLGKSIDDYVFREHILKAMTEYAAQERNRAIQECQDIVQKFDFENQSDFWCLCELEKLKTS